MKRSASRVLLDRVREQIEGYLNAVTKQYGDDPVLREKLDILWSYIIPPPSAGGFDSKLS